MSTPAPPKLNGSGSEGLWKWVAAIIVALLIGLTPYIVSSRNYVEKTQLEPLQLQVNHLENQVAVNSQRITDLEEQVLALSTASQGGIDRLALIEQALARLEAVHESLTNPPTDITPR